MENDAIEFFLKDTEGLEKVKLHLFATLIQYDLSIKDIRTCIENYIDNLTLKDMYRLNK
jgi:hypothetical protein